MKLQTLFAAAMASAFLSVSAASAATINIDLSGATTATLITAPGGSFAQTFAGQTVVGTGISGSPTNPLTLAPSGSLDVAFFDPGVSSAGNSILPQPNNQAPLSILLSSSATSITWTMGFADSAGPVTVDFFNAQGGLTGSIVQALLTGYNVYTFSGVGVFAGLTIFNDNDPAGMRFMNFSYNSVSDVPLPAALPLFATGLAGLGLLGWRRKRKAQAAA